MCTLVVMKNMFSGYPLVVAANRDELFNRPAEAPTITELPHKILAPTDLARGGRWIGVNERPLLVALTNRKAIRSVRGLRSRGELVADALKQPTLALALSSVMDRASGEHNGCYMVMTDGKDGHVITGNGVGGTDARGRDIEPGFTREPLPDGLTIITNLGLGAESPRGGAIMREWGKLRPTDLPPPRFSAFVPMLTRHEVDLLEGNFRDRRRTDLCQHPTEDDPDYGTVSSSVIRLSDVRGGDPKAWHYWHGVREKRSAAFCGIRWSAMLTLPIRLE